ncbi:nucleoside-diphosphate sugar epimerase/dehydratase [Geoalkalibacter halelectricus]|uniref:PglD N-terminal domain-containing protein n=1 Tax=Geoalkalibacter halelectricus TaxID=2847045 RepID=A0ABY5ZRR3_9BACT|nr:hypothetical protein [Geoalkalibacter halelectricus]MDO3377963.1 hypothetical protein [Geoalkalibacter halelectricus]UWZ81534.1 hypothetical protein L9S41_09080 [Geoalkalibacter halelectricus]
MKINSKSKKLIIFGIGKGGQHGFKFFKKNYNIIAFCDNNSKMYGEYFFNIPVIGPYDIERYDFDEIAICSSYKNEIYEQLVSELGFSPNKINILDNDILIFGPGKPFLFYGLSFLIFLGLTSILALLIFNLFL